MSKRKLFELRGRQSVPGEDPSAPSVTISQAWLAPRQPITSMADLHYHPNSDHIMSASMIDGMDREHSEPPIDGQRSAQSSGQSVRGPQSIVSQRQIPKCSKCRNHFVETPVKNHKHFCKFKECHWEKCILMDERRSNGKKMMETTANDPGVRYH